MFSLALAVTVQVALAGTVEKPESDNSIAAERATFKLLDGFSVNCFASEADGIANPVAIRFDARGRLWVLTTLAYPQLAPTEIGNDSLVILEDTDDDGVADKRTVFADRLNMPTGFALGRGGVYLGERNDLLFLPDANGDDKADGREVLFSGFGTGDTHQNVNSFSWSPGGELHFCQGLHTFSRVETPWGIVRLDEHGSWRLRPLRRQLTPFHRSASGGNPWGITFGHWGEPFIKSNGTPIGELLPLMVDTPYFEDYWRSGADIGGTKIKSMIIEFIDSPHFPDEMQGQMLIAGYYAHDVPRLSMDADGAGHKLANLPPLLTSSSRSFRPVDIQTGPRGAIYVADWYNPIIGHYQASLRHPDRDKTHGRIWRITAKNRPLGAKPELAELSASQLVAKLASPVRFERYHAKRLLADGEAGTVRAALDAALAEGVADEHHLFEVLGCYEAHEIIKPELLQRLLTAKDHRARAYATRAIGRWHDRLPEPLGLLERAVNDAHPRVRLEAIVAASGVRVPSAITIATQALRHPTDRFIELALRKTVHGLKAEWFPALTGGELVFGSQMELAFVLKTAGGKEVVRSLQTLLTTAGLAPAVREEVAVVLAGAGNPVQLRWLIDHVAATPRILEALAEAANVRQVRPEADLTATVGEFLASADSAIRVAAVALAVAWRTQGHADNLTVWAKQSERGTIERLAAVAALPALRGAAARGDLLQLAGEASAPEIRSAAVTALVELDLDAAAAVAVRLMREPENAEQVTTVMAGFMGRTGGLASLAKALADSEALPTESADQIRAALSAAGRHSPELSAVLSAGNRPNLVGMPAYSEAFIKQLTAEVKADGNADAGAKVYRSPNANCAACHRIGDAGGVLGPDLTAIGSGMAIEMMIESVLWPRRQVKEGYLSTSLTTKSGKIVNGYVAREDATAIVIRDIATGTTETIAKKAVASREDAGTLMPPGLTAAMTRAELRDLIAYLASRRK